MNRYGLLIGLILLLASCRAKPGTAETKERSYTDSSVVQQRVQFPFPEIPATLTEPEARKAWLLIHYWEQFDFADTTLVNNRDVTEQGCSGFVGQEHARQVLTQTADSYLFNSNSPFYNEGLYGMYLEALLGKLPQTDAMRSAYRFKLELVKRNNVGDKATDFTYYQPDGTRRTLATTSVKNDRLLLMFYDPECESCHEVLLQMAADTALAEAVRTGKLSVLAVYTEGNDEAWRKALPDMPEGWTVGTDREAVKTGALYDLKAMPSLYLLDGSKTVLLKDAAYEKIRTTLAF